LPVPEPDRSTILAVRRGGRDIAEVVELVERAARDIIEACDESPVPELADKTSVERWMIGAYERTWAHEL
jgi:uncharacterized protein